VNIIGKVSGAIGPHLHCLISHQLLWLVSYYSIVAMECFLVTTFLHHSAGSVSLASAVLQVLKWQQLFACISHRHLGSYLDGVTVSDIKEGNEFDVGSGRKRPHLVYFEVSLNVERCRRVNPSLNTKWNVNWAVGDSVGIMLQYDALCPLSGTIDPEHQS